MHECTRPYRWVATCNNEASSLGHIAPTGPQIPLGMQYHVRRHVLLLTVKASHLTNSLPQAVLAAAQSDCHLACMMLTPLCFCWCIALARAANCFAAHSRSAFSLLQSEGPSKVAQTGDSVQSCCSHSLQHHSARSKAPMTLSSSEAWCRHKRSWNGPQDNWLGSRSVRS